ncbi:MAG: peptidoglycan DD-metalloendopeptidase family protein [Patescibacteria group bacterium]
MKKQKSKTNKILAIFGVIVVTLFLFNFKSIFSQARTSDQLILELQQDVELKKLEIDKLEKRIKVYEDNLEAKRKEKISLTNELEILSEKINQLELELERNQLQIDSVNLEIQSVLLKISDQEGKIAEKKNQIAELIQLISYNDDQNYLEILASHQTFSDFFDQVYYTQKIESNLKNSLDGIKILKADLEEEKTELDTRSQELAGLKEELEKNKAKLDEQEGAKTYYLVKAKQSEKQFQSLISQAQQEQQAINNEIVGLERTLRKQLAEADKALPSTGSLVWPVPKNVVTSYFHDPDYPFRYIFEHPAIDIRAAQGTPVKAADSGYVGKVQNGGKTGYSYIMIIHDKGLSTVYGHVSKIYVKEDSYVSQGDIIGLSGGTPGTSGAGRLCTGPHMHFEVRLDGIPVNPLDYLP